MGIMMTEGVVSESEAKHGHGSQHEANKHHAAEESKSTSLNVEGAASHPADAEPAGVPLNPVTLGVCAVAAGLVILMMGAMIAGGRRRRKTISKAWGASATVQTELP